MSDELPECCRAAVERERAQGMFIMQHAEINDTTGAFQPTQAKAEPVAWRYQPKDSLVWTFALVKQQFHVPSYWRQEPLYAHPPTNELITALQRAKEWLQGSEPHRAKYLGEVLDRVAHPPVVDDDKPTSAEVEAMAELLEAWSEGASTETFDRAAAMLRKLDGDKRDAERYRWIRDDPQHGMDWRGNRFYEMQSSDECDAAIDAAIAKERP